MGFSVAIVARGRSLEKCESKLMGFKKKEKKKAFSISTCLSMYSKKGIMSASKHSYNI